MSSPFNPFPQYELSCRAEVNGMRVEVRQLVDARLYDQNRDARYHIERELRHRLIEEILKQAPPKIYRRQ